MPSHPEQGDTPAHYDVFVLAEIPLNRRDVLYGRPDPAREIPHAHPGLLSRSAQLRPARYGRFKLSAGDRHTRASLHHSTTPRLLTK